MPPRCENPSPEVDMVALRSQIRSGNKVRLRYRDEQERITERIVWPVAVAYLEMTRLLAGWCELRSDFRHFRTDRIIEMTLLEVRYPARPAALRVQWRRSLGNPPKH
jgi:predicted DNA-binding transcriptional regulator YafY